MSWEDVSAPACRSASSRLPFGENLGSIMPVDATYKPILRPVEVCPDSGGDETRVGVRDRSGLSTVELTLSRPALMILALMDGAHTCEEIRQEFHAACGQPVSSETLGSIVRHLENAHFLEGPGFESHFDSLQARYRGRGVRRMPHPQALGLDGDVHALFREVLAEAQEADTTAGTIRGIIAPHLDYPRGRPCYAAAYAALSGRECPTRVVILGTNHAGRARSVVATGNDFETPLGRTRTDVDFLRRVENLCGDLRTCELDHMHEHSIELQVPWLQHLFGVGDFMIVPFLIPDVCGPTGTAPAEGRGVDVRDFAAALADAIAEDGGDTLLVAGADLSHVGAAFGDERTLDESYLGEVRRHDLAALDRLAAGGADAFREYLTTERNHTNMCSAGSMFSLGQVLARAHVTRIAYHQAVDQATQTCVTCAALVFA